MTDSMNLIPRISRLASCDNVIFPIGIIALFVFLIEAIATVSLKFVIGTQFVGHLVWFIILDPTFIALAFFAFLSKKREACYSTYDFRSDDTLQELLRSVEVLKAKQDIALIDESTRVDDAIRQVDHLLALGDVLRAIVVLQNSRKSWVRSYKKIWHFRLLTALLA